MKKLVAGMLLAGAAFAACGGGEIVVGPDREPAVDLAQTLWKARTAYVGDNSKVIGLTRAAGFGPDGSYTLSLQTAKRPYGATVTLDHLDKAFADVDYVAPATLLLGTVANLDAVRVVSDDESYTLTAEEATRRLGHDVKTLGRDEKALAAYVSSLGG